ncbi:hypothetical protein PAI11_38480 [Patulibacter medicamentivorans]|uniref:Uncharacterized protein n=1 Tax=Patulibacter medicamentivorans TaxID=1097667 RepID=H0EAH4_9ACTN|nr:hypothetical protein [Patulibacter medicamentivorans]EHN09301.1 hypothetical protein PAI11_38480 [Patulibacter medicamentivorans]
MTPARTLAITAAVALASLAPATGASAQDPPSPTALATPGVVVGGKWSACKAKHNGKFFKTLGCFFTPCRPSGGNLEPPGSSGNPPVYGGGLTCNF